MAELSPSRAAAIDCNREAHAAWGRRAHRLEPDPVTAPVVSWMFAQRLAGHSAARITRALNDAGVPCPSAADPGRNPHRAGRGWTLRTVAAILANPRYTGRQVWNRQRTDRRSWSTRPTPGSGTSRCSGGTCPRAGSSPSIPRTPRWSAKPTSSPPRTPPRRAARPAPRPAGTCWPGSRCGRCGRRLESAWSNGKPAYRCRHGYTSATRPDPGRPKNAYVREDQILPHLAALAILLAGPAGRPGRGSRSRAADRPRPSTAALIDQLRADGTVLTYDPDSRTLRAGGHDALSVTIGTDAADTTAPGQGKEDRLGRSEKQSTRRGRRLSAGDDRACP